MHGMRPLIETRRSGERPKIVFIDTDAGPRALPAWAQWQNASPALCSIDITPADSLLRLDFRPLIGLVVQVSGTNDARVRAVANLVKDAGAKRVVSCCMEQIGKDEFIAFRQLWVEDTAGIFGEASHADAA